MEIWEFHPSLEPSPVTARLSERNSSIRTFSMCPISTFLASEHDLGTANYENKIDKVLIFCGFQVQDPLQTVTDNEGRILVLRRTFWNFVQV